MAYSDVTAILLECGSTATDRIASPPGFAVIIPDMSCSPLTYVLRFESALPANQLPSWSHNTLVNHSRG